jgi:hypothetical protein
MEVLKKFNYFFLRYLINEKLPQKASITIKRGERHVLKFFLIILLPLSLSRREPMFE